jgi:hypothetical protein
MPKADRRTILIATALPSDDDLFRRLEPAAVFVCHPLVGDRRAKHYAAGRQAGRLERAGSKDVTTADAPCFPTVAAGIDQELLQLCDRFNVLERHIRTLWLSDDQNVWARLNSEQQEIVDKIEALPPKTLFGFQAVARALIGWWPEMPEDQIGDLNDIDANMMIFLLRNLVEMPDTTISCS